MEFPQLLSQHLVSYPFLLTENLISYTDYRNYFENKYDCKFTFRLPNPLSPKDLAENFSPQVVQTYFEVVSSNQGQMVVPTTVFQFDVEAHLLITYNLDDKNKFVSYGMLTLKSPPRYLELLSLLSKFEIKEEKRIVGFGAHIGSN